MKRISYFKVIVVLLILLSLGNIAYALSLPTAVNGKSTLSDLPLLEYSVNGNRNYFVVLPERVWVTPRCSSP
jgi:predicted phosphohydrolase